MTFENKYQVLEVTHAEPDWHADDFSVDRIFSSPSQKAIKGHSHVRGSESSGWNFEKLARIEPSRRTNAPGDNRTRGSKPEEREMG